VRITKKYVGVRVRLSPSNENVTEWGELTGVVVRVWAGVFRFNADDEGDLSLTPNWWRITEVVNGEG
jgi:hypothetical protein